VPDYVRTDNGPAFRSKEFTDIAQQLGFKHIKVTPLWPQANGLAESFMKNLGKVIKTAFIDRISWKTRLTEFLRNYRSTPHATTNVAPITLFLRNGDTTRLPKYKNSFIPSLIDDSARRLDNYKIHIQKSNAEIRKKP
jgi:transposase InsO family protein